MAQAQFAPPPGDFAYGAANDAAGLKLALSIYADRAHLRGQLREDAEGAGFRIAEAAGINALHDAQPRPLGEVVLVDCPAVDAATLAALTRLDLRAAHAGAALVVSTTVAALDDVFACLDQSSPQILVEPGRAERLVALGQVLARIPGRRVRELSEEDRLVLLRLAHQVSSLAERIDQLHGPEAAAAPAPAPTPVGAFRFEPARHTDGAEERLLRTSRAPLPDPKLVRRIIRQRQMRARFLDGDLFADPAWDMLLDLTAARAEQTRVSVTSLCIASGVQPTTALRWIGQMTEAGLLQRVEDDTDRRRAFITLTDKAVEAMSRYFAELGGEAARLI
jgi:hypothetical protein